MSYDNQEIDEAETGKNPNKSSTNRTSITRSSDSTAKHQLKEKLELHRRSHNVRGRGHKKVSAKEKKVIKKRLKDSDNYVLEQGRLITQVALITWKHFMFAFIQHATRY